MDNFQKTAEAMSHLLKISRSFRSGEIPSIYEVLGIYGELNHLYFEINNELSNRFNAKERAYIDRKLYQANQERALRETLSVGDSKTQALKDTKDKYYTELEKMEFFEKTKLFSNSIRSSLDFCRSLKSSIETMETNYSPQTT